MQIDRPFDHKVLRGLHAYLFGISNDPLHLNPSIVSELRRFRPDVIVLYGYIEPTNLLAYAFGLMTETPFILTLDGGDIERQPRVLRFIVQGIVRNAAGYLVACENARRILLYYGASLQMITDLPCVTDLSQMHDTVKSIRMKETKTDFNSDSRMAAPKTILFIGRLVREKGVLELLDAFDRLQKDHPRLRLIIVGRGPLRKRIEAVARSFPSESLTVIEYLREDELVALYAKADVFVMPSLQEPFGIVACEAFAAGLPVVATSACGSVEVLPTSPWVVIVPPGNPESLANGIENALNLKSFDDANHTQQVEAFLETVTFEALAARFENAILRSLKS
jgi:glycosyltransferase involved in cell wall biosynthesis